MVDLKGIGSEGVIGLMLYLIWKDLIVPRWRSHKYQKEGKDRRKNNPNSKPGNAPICKDNRDKLIKLETQVANIDKRLNKRS